MNSQEFHEHWGVALQISTAEGDPAIKVVDPDGEILEIEKVQFSTLNGGEIHIVAKSYDD